MLHRTNEHNAQQIKEINTIAKNQRKANKEKSKNERILKAELQQLEQMRKYYIISSKQEIKKVCDRFDNRIAKHCFYKDPKKNSEISDTTSLSSVQTTLDVINNFSPTRVSTSRISSRQSSGINPKTNFESASSIEFSKVNDTKNTLNQQSLLDLVNKMKNTENNTIMGKSKKTVSWNSSSMNNMSYGQNDLLKSENSNLINRLSQNNNSAINSSSLNKNEKNRRESIKNPIEMRNSPEKKSIDNINNIRRGSTRSPDLKSKARLGSSKSNNEGNPGTLKKINTSTRDSFGRVISAISAVKSFNALNEEDEDEENKKISNFQITKMKKKEDDHINQFLNSLKTTDSGFYTYLNSKGQPTCSGYDNFATLNKFNSASTTSISSSLSPQKSEKHTTEKNPLINNLDTTFLDLRKTKKKLKKTTIEDDAEFLKSSSILFNESLVLNQSINDDDDYVANSPEAKKLYDNIFRAQTTRNLTLKKLVL